MAVEDASEALLSIRNGMVKSKTKQEQPEEFSPASLGLHPVGDSPSKKKQSSPQPPVLNRRGMPARIRKKNRLFFDDELVNSVVPKSMLKSTRVKTPKEPSTPKEVSPKKGRKPKEPSAEQPPSPSKVENGNKKVCQKIGMRLRNLLKLPKAHKWVCYEWFYSNIDSALFGGENDFTICLKESFPQLKTFMLTRVEWCKMRRLMGKPRRCSQSFFEEERRELEKKRSKIRQLQQRKPTDPNSCKDLPSEIPLQLVIGTKVTARLRGPQDGLFTGSVDAYDTSNNTYRITFERNGIGTHSIPDFEVLSNEPVETISVTSMVQALRIIPKPAISAMSSINDPSRCPSPPGSVKNEVPYVTNDFPPPALESIVLLNKILLIKSQKVNALQTMNAEVERRQCFSIPIHNDFLRKYASCVIELEQINTALRQIVSSVREHCQEMLPDVNMSSVLTPSHIRERSLDEAKSMIDKVGTTVDKPSIIDLIIELTALIIQVKSLSEVDRNSFEAEVLVTSLNAIKQKLSARNKNVFENAVEVHMKHIQSALSGDIAAYSSSAGRP